MRYRKYETVTVQNMSIIDTNDQSVLVVAPKHF